MSTTNKTIDLTFERTIPAAPGEVFNAWLDSSIPGTPFHEHEKLIIDLKIDGLWYWLVRGNAHYGRYIEIDRPEANGSGRMRQSWMSRHTLGEESMVTVSFQKKGENTLMTLVHSGLPNEEAAEKHDKGWTFLLHNFVEVHGSKNFLQK